MKGSGWRHLIPAIALGILAAASLPQGVRAQDDDEPSFEQKLIRGVLHGFGLIEDEPNIDYHERAPLVVPPGVNLPAPQRDANAAASPNWPKDPDAERAKRSAVKDNQPIMRTDNGNVLRIDEIRRGVVVKKPQPKSDRPDLPSERLEGANTRLTPEQLGFTGWNMKKDDKLVFTGEPERARLTQPPAGLQTPSPTQPYGVVGEDKLDDNWLNRIFSPSKVAEGQDSGGSRTARDNAK